MDQIKIGKFIAACRKEQGMTQAALAEKLGISDRAVSKWETGKSMPDSGIMLELCKLLKINVNELLSGERIMSESYDNRAEENLIRLRMESEELSRKMLRLESLILCIALFAFAVMVVFGVIISYKTPDSPMWVILFASAALIVFASALVGVWIEQAVGYYECADCGYKYQPTYMQALMAPHMGRSRKMTCPHCGKRNYHKKVISNK